MTVSGDDIMKIAARAAGEAQVLGWPGVYMVAATILDRLASMDFPDDLDEVLKAYCAPDASPVQRWHIEAVLAAVRDAGDIEPLYYALSREDIQRLGVPRERADYVLERGRWGLYLFREWPVEKSS
ncbi:MAG: hypothetical protein KatS3mg051_1164 [Anaerolineae bacterium]|nr:MAG: hypothetical protein KatS3mg051_1164 [Anaerolineae bacterium]